MGLTEVELRFVQDTKRFRDRPNFAEVGTAIGIVGGVWGLWFSNALVDPGASLNCAEQQCECWSAAAPRTTGSWTAGAPIKGGLQGETSMTTISSAGTVSGAGTGILDKERTIATAGFNRWLVPPAALCIHLCIGMAYGFSVFWLPLSRAIGLTAPKACPDMSLMQELFTTTCDWKVASMGWMFTLFFVVLGVSAAVWGGWLERVGPRKAGFVAALCWSGGLVLGAIGIYTHQLWLMWLGSGVIGGIGLGLGYISPVSTLVKWFPDRRGMATGMAIMGFGGGAMIGAPLANLLMNYFKTPTSVGVWETFLAMAVIYFVFMMIGAFSYRISPPNWQPEGWTPPSKANAMISSNNVHLDNAHKTRQFWLIWWVLCLNVSAGIGVIGMASPMLQEIFAGKLIGLPNVGFNALDASQKATIAGIAAGFAGLLSLFNIGGRFFWASLSDKIGRKNTYYTFFILGIVLYALAPTFAMMGSKLLFVLGFGIILSMYGGGFSTVPAYLADMFGTQFVGAIHGRLLTAWSTAGIIGPVVVNYIREFQLAAGVPRDHLYNTTMYILCAMLIAGFICNYLIKPVDAKWHMSEAEVAKLQAASASATAGPSGSYGIGFGGLDVKAAMFWAFVGIPLAWGVWKTLESAVKIL
jgi:MFS family permease